jgi:hypothetical protein
MDAHVGFMYEGIRLAASQVAVTNLVSSLVVVVAEKTNPLFHGAPHAESRTTVPTSHEIPSPSATPPPTANPMMMARLIW